MSIVQMVCVGAFREREQVVVRNNRPLSFRVHHKLPANWRREPTIVSVYVFTDAEPDLWRYRFWRAFTLSEFRAWQDKYLRRRK